MSSNQTSKKEEYFTCTNGHVLTSCPNFPHCECEAWIVSTTTEETIDGSKIIKGIDFSYENRK